MTTTIFQAKPLYLLPRPDRLYQQYRGQQRQSLIPRERLETILGAYGLQGDGHVEVPKGSGRSSNIIVSTNRGKKLLKGYKNTLDHDAIIHEHSILRYLADVHFPAPRLNVAMNGATLLRHGKQNYALFDVLAGYFQYHNYVFLPKRSRQFVICAGQALGALHATLKNFTPDGRHVNGFKSADEDRWHGLTWYLERLTWCRNNAQGGHEDQRRSQATRLQRAADWLEETLCSLNQDLTAAKLPRLIIHGDYGPYNLFFKPGAPVVILDFELARLDWRLADLATSLPSFANGRLGFHRGKMRAFLTAYRANCPIDQEELNQLPSVWQFLVLRRIIVCWYRYLQTDSTHWLNEALRKLELAQWLTRRQQMLADVCRLDKE
jgi:Ser/Thr protein kinase RdoA (MazF antagonist)